MPRVNIPGVGTVNFPYSMSQQQIEAEAERLMASAGAPTAPQVQPESGMGFLERAKLSFAGSDQDRLATLQAQFGKENVTQTPDGLAFRRTSTEPFKMVDQAGFSLSDLPGDIADWAGDVPEIAGGTIAGIAGAAAGGPVGAVATGALGTAAGRSAKHAIADMLGVQRPQGLAAATDLAAAGLVGAASEFGGIAIAKGASRLMPSVKPDQLVDDALDFFSTNALTKEANVGLTPAQVSKSKVLGTVEGFLEGSMSSRHLEYFKTNTQEVMGKVADDMAARFGKSVEPDDLAQTIIDTVEGNFKIARAPAKAVRREIENKGASLGLTVPTQPLKKFALPFSKAAKELKGIGGASVGDTLMMKLSSLEDEIPLNAAISLRTRIRSIADEFSVNNKKAPVIGLAKRLESSIGDSIKDVLGRQAPDLLPLWNESNLAFATAERRYNNKFLRSLIARGDPKVGGIPEDLVTQLFRPRSTTRIRMLKTALNDGKDPAFQQLQSFGIQKILSEAMVQAQDGSTTLSGNKLLGLVKGKGFLELGGFGKETIEELLGPQMRADLIKFASALSQSQKTIDGGGKFAAMLQVVGAVGKVMTGGGISTQTAGIFLGPEMLARFWVSPKMRNLLIGAARKTADHPSKMILGNRLTAYAAGMDTALSDYLNQVLGIGPAPPEERSIQTPEGSVVNIAQTQQ